MNANIAFAPTHTNGLYDTLGIDLFNDAYTEARRNGEDVADADHIQWIEAADQDEDNWNLDAAEQTINDAGYRVVGREWEDCGDYRSIAIEAL